MRIQVLVIGLLADATADQERPGRHAKKVSSRCEGGGGDGGAEPWPTDRQLYD